MAFPLKQARKCLLFLDAVHSCDASAGLESLRGLSYLLEHFPESHQALATPKFLQTTSLAPSMFQIRKTWQRSPFSTAFSPHRTNSRASAVNLVSFAMIAGLLRGSDTLKRLSCRCTRQIIRANDGALSGGGVFGALVGLANQCFLVRETAVRTAAARLPRIRRHGEAARPPRSRTSQRRSIERSRSRSARESRQPSRISSAQPGRSEGSPADLIDACVDGNGAARPEEEGRGG
jgi:hypothetical protein